MAHMMLVSASPVENTRVNSGVLYQSPPDWAGSLLEGVPVEGVPVWLG